MMWYMHKRSFCRRETTEKQEQRLGDQSRGYCRRSVERNGARPRVVLVARERSRWFPGIICQQIWKPQKWPQDWISSAFIPISKKGNAKEHSDCCTTVLILPANKVMFKIIKLDFSSIWTENFQMYKLSLEEKAEESELKMPTFIGS